MCNVECLVGHASSCEIIAQSGTEVLFFSSRCVFVYSSRSSCKNSTQSDTEVSRRNTEAVFFFSVYLRVSFVLFV